MLYLKEKNWFPKNIIIIPIITSAIIPLAITDLWIEIYHRTCFPLYKIPYVDRKKYIQVMDRFHLPYLSLMQKLYCAYCGYGNGVIRYWGEIAAETEAYWCGIQHKKIKDFIEHKHHKDFAKYGSEKDFKEKYMTDKKKIPSEK